MKTFVNLLYELGACNEAQIFCSGKTLEQAWQECPRGDWMLWLYYRSKDADKRLLTLAKGYCAKTVEHLMTDAHSKKAVQAAIDYGNGLINDEELKQITDDAAADAAYADYAYADYAAAYAVDVDADVAADVAADAAAADAAAADAAAADAADAAKKANQLETAEICRKYLPLPKFDL
jgi:hypothetical protein